MRWLPALVPSPPAWLALLVALGAGACRNPVGVHESGFEPVYRKQRLNVLDGGQLSELSLQVLESFGLEGRYREAPLEAIESLTAIADRERLRSLHVYIAEMHYQVALGSKDQGGFLAAAAHAYHGLFGEGYDAPLNPYSRNFRLACDLYNRGLAQALRAPDGTVRFEDTELETPIGRVTIEARRPGFPWDASEFSTFLPADAYEVRGLRERIRNHGLGMPLIAVQSSKGVANLTSEHIGREVKLPATAFLRFDSRPEAEDSGSFTATLELYLSTDEEGIRVGAEGVPLESDLTAPLAYMLEDSDLWKFSLAGFFNGITGLYETGVFMLQPYQAHKIPLVLVHGTASSPATWAQTINGLCADPRLRDRYQIWLALYNSGNPIAYSAMGVRESLRELANDLDPEGDDAGLHRTVLIGHSQGGLVSRLLVTTSGDETWSHITEIPLDELALSDEHRQLLRKCIWFEPLSFVERAVFISTPHRGSYVAGGWVGSLAMSFIKLPQDLAGAAEGILKRGDLPPELRRISTSVENMEPDSKFVGGLEHLPIAEGVHLNSIISVLPGFEEIEGGHDGVVEYTSAHFERAESEYVVRSRHTCQGAPETIGELRRILFEHVGGRGLERVE